MHLIKGFATINTMLDGGMNAIAPLGELSSYSRTFSTIKASIAKREYESVSIEVFNCTEDGISKDMPAGSDDYVLGRLEDIIENFDDSLDFATQFNSRYEMDLLQELGNDVTHDGRTLPSMVKWQTNILGEPVIFKIWLSDAVFRAEYGEYEIRVLPPVPNATDLMENRSVVLGIVEDYDYSKKMEDIETIRNGDPSTSVVTLKLQWVDPITDFSTELVWTLVTYGPAGLTRDNQLKAIREYLLRETGRDAGEWLPWLPDLLIHTTLTLIPVWDRVALRSSGSVEYVFDPTITVAEIKRVSRIRYGLAGANEAQLAKLVFGVIQYKSMGFIVLSEDNSGEEGNFTELYPDYSLIPLNDLNLNRLSAKTRSAIMAIEKGVRLAEVDTGNGTLPSDHTRMTADGIDYIVYTVNGVTHRIATRRSYMANV